MKLEIKLIDSNKNILLKEEFDPRGFYEVPFVHFANELGLIDLPNELFLNTSQAFEKRLNITIDDDLKNELLENEDIDSNDREFLELAINKNYQEVNTKYFSMLIQNIEYCNIEDIKSFIDDNSDLYNKANKISFELK